MKYDAAVDWLCNKIPFFYKEGASAYKKDLDNIKLLLTHIDNPHNNFKSIHIAGTNGKGSVSHMLSSILQESGYVVGMFTSPHILDFRERIKINEKKINKDFVTSFISQNADLKKNINFSFFEITSAMCFQYFSEQKIDIAIIECGLGGRLDSTNIINPILSIITNVSLDHSNILGNDLMSIAKEKSGIIKEGVPFLTSEKKVKILNLFRQISFNKNAPFFSSKLVKLKDNILDNVNFQLENLSTVKSSLDILNDIGFNISMDNFKLGIENLKNNTGFMCRWDVVSNNPLIICDIAHNPSAIGLVMSQLVRIKQKKHIVLGFSAEKDIDKIFEKINIDAKYYFCSSNNSRVLSPKKYINQIQSLKFEYKIFNDSLEVLNYLTPILNKNEMIFITGSAFVVSDAFINFR